MAKKFGIAIMFMAAALAFTPRPAQAIGPPIYGPYGPYYPRYYPGYYPSPYPGFYYPGYSYPGFYPGWRNYYHVYHDHR